MDKISQLLFGLGLLVMLIVWLPLLLRSLPLSLPIVCMAIGFCIHQAHFIPFDIGALRTTRFPELGSEFVVLMALMGAGLKIDRRFGWRAWATAWRLLGIAMPLTIVAMMLLAVYVAHFPLPTALLIAAALAPTDPVLASGVEVGPPGVGEEGEVRFSLTAEAGFNDGLAFPIVSLALALVAGTHVGVEWIGTHFFWRTALSIVSGWMLGVIFGWFVFRVPRLRLSGTGNGLAAVAITFLSFSITEALDGYGFIAVFITALKLRSVHWDSKFHRAMSDFSDQIVRIVAMLLITLFGWTLAAGLLDALTWPDALVGLSLILIVRPITAWISLLGSPHPAVSRAASSFFGIRGIGTLYYLVYSQYHGNFMEADRLKSLIAFVVLCSIILHGLTATPFMRRLDEIRARLNERKSG